MRKTIILFVLSCLVFPIFTDAQQRSVSGRIQTDNNAPVAGASIQLLGTNRGTTTDQNGNFVISASSGDTLLISSLGFISEKIAVGDGEISLTMQPNPEMLQETVVTALGVKQQARALGYSTTEIPGDNLTKARVPNLGESLSGQVAGVSVGGVSTGPGGSSRVVIRGNASLGGNNQPLYVIDGIPYDNTNQGRAILWGGWDYGDGLTNINPDDIESIQVLKSVAASALYGYRGGNGAILITTKSGARNGRKGIGVEVNNNLTFEKAVDTRDYQYEYGQGLNGVKPVTQEAAYGTARYSWGAKADGSDAVNLFNQTYKYSPQKENWEHFFRTGLTNETSVALTGSSESATFRLGLTNNYTKAVIPNSSNNQQGVNFNSIFHINPKLQVNITANWNIEKVKNRPSFSDDPRNPISPLYFIATTYDINWLKDTMRYPDGLEVTPGERIYFENPWFVANEFQNSTNRQRLTSGVTIKYNLLNWLYVQGQITRDAYTFEIRSVNPSGVRYTVSPGNLGGTLEQHMNTFRELNGSVMLGVDKDFGQDFNLTGFVGTNRQDDITKSFGFGPNGPFLIPYFYSANNIADKQFNYSFSHYRVNSVYGSVTGSYKDFLYLTGTARNDWFSTLNINSNHFLYPSVSGSFVFSSVTSLPSWINFGKVRVSWAEGSNGTSPYQNALTYGLQPWTINNQPLGAINNATIPNPNLKPIIIREAEVGLSLRMLSNRLGLDVDYYSKKTRDDIVPVTISTTSGYSGNVINVGQVRNNGIEFLINGTPVQTRNFSWDASFNMSVNFSKVLDLGGVQSLAIANSQSRWGAEVNISNVVGLPYGQIMGFKYKRNDAGEMIIDENTGMPEHTGVVALGAGTYKTIGGFSNNFRYGNFSLSVLFDFKYGAKIYSATNNQLYEYGLHQNTLEGREGGMIAPGVYEDGTHNTQAIDAQIYWRDLATGADHVTEEFLYDASFIKLRSASLAYSLPARLLGTSFIKGATFSIVARNLATIMKHTPNIDPESNYSDSNAQGLELAGYPYLRSLGFNVNIQF